VSVSGRKRRIVCAKVVRGSAWLVGLGLWFRVRARVSIKVRVSFHSGESVSVGRQAYSADSSDAFISHTPKTISPSSKPNPTQ